MSHSQNHSGLVPAICTQCGAQLNVDPDQRVTTCHSCGTEFVTQQAITNYNIYITNNTTINQTVVGKKGAVQSVFEYLDHAGERSHAQYMEQLRKEEEERRKAEEGRKSCLFVIGLFTVPYIAIPVYIASKNKEKREAEEVQRQQRIAAEAAAREQARLQAQERLREIQAKRPTSTEISALLNNLKDVRCPNCDVPVDVKMENPTVHCAYCDSVLPTIDLIQGSSLPAVSKQRLIDEIQLRNVEEIERQKQAEEQKAWEEQQQIRAVAESEKQRNNSYNNAILVFSIITGLLLIALVNSPFIGAAFFIPSLIILCFLLYRRFPEKGKAVWDRIKYPLSCVVLFPLPLTAYFNQNEKYKERFPKAARIRMSIGAWAIYAALIVTLGGLYVKGFKNAIDRQEISQYEPASDSTPASTTNSTKPSTQTVTTQPQMNGFNTLKNQSFSLGGIDWQIPYYFDKDEKNCTDTFMSYYVTWPDTTENTMLWIGTEKLDFSESEFNNKKKYIQDTLAEKINMAVDESDDISFAGLPGYVFAFSDEKGTIQGLYVFAFNAETKDFVRIGMAEPTSKCKSISDDFVQIIKYAKTATENAASTAESKEATITNITSDATTITEVETTIEPEPEIYPQEDAFRAAVVAITNSLATDVFTNDGSRHDTAKYHGYSDTSAFYMSVLSKGTWTEKNSSTWHVDGLRLQPDGYDTVYQTPINFDTVAKVSLDVSFDGSNYIVSNISGMYAIPGKEDIGTNLSYLNSDSMSKAARTVSPGMIQNGRS